LDPHRLSLVACEAKTYNMLLQNFTVFCAGQNLMYLSHKRLVKQFQNDIVSAMIANLVRTFYACFRGKQLEAGRPDPDRAVLALLFSSLYSFLTFSFSVVNSDHINVVERDECTVVFPEKYSLCLEDLNFQGMLYELAVHYLRTDQELALEVPPRLTYLLTIRRCSRWSPNC